MMPEGVFLTHNDEKSKRILIERCPQELKSTRTSSPSRGLPARTYGA
jgi:hypothetical protein